MEQGKIDTMDIQAGMIELNAGRVIGREGSNHANAQWYLHTEDGKPYLFQRVVKASTGKVIESPAVFDWDDMSATNWKVIN